MEPTTLRRRPSVRYLRSVTRPAPSGLLALAHRPYERLAFSAVVAFAAFACKAKPKPPPQNPAPSASVSAEPAASAAPEATAHCKSLSETASLRVGEAERSRAPAGEDEDELDEAALPFATRVDAAVALDDARPLGGSDNDAVFTPGASTMRTMRATDARQRSGANGKSAFASSATFW